MIKGPFLWFGQEIHGVPKPWLEFKMDGVMVNAYEILQKTKTIQVIAEKGIHRYLKFKGPIMMDSGGFLFMQKNVMDVDPEAIVDLYEESKPDFGVVLDHPLGAGLNYHQKKVRQLKTLTNTKIMLRYRKTRNPMLMPVIHGHTISSIEWFVKQLNKIGDFPIYGLGSLVPSVFNAKGVGGIYNVVKLVSHVRKMLPDKKIHIFGVGSTVTMHLMFYSGADSVDTTAWRTKAAHGAIQLSGIGDRYITGKAGKATHKKYLDVSGDEKKLLEDCKCPACTTTSIYELRKSYRLRAMHNAWVFQKEVEKARRLIRRSKYDDYLRDIVSSTRFSKVFELAKKLGSALVD